METPDPRSAADELIAGGAPLSRIRKLFGSKDAALRYYAESTADRYAVPAATCLCSAPAVFPARYTWRAIYNARFAPNAIDLLLLFAGVFRIGTSASVLRFTTHHGSCQSCWRRAVGKRALANIVHFLSLFLGVISGTCAAIGLSSVMFFYKDPTWREERTGLLLFAGGNVVAFALCVAAFSLANRLRVPPALRSIPRFPFRFERVDR
jgi:hypothetical protein